MKREKGETISKKIEAEDMPKAVLFVQNTPESTLAKNLRKMLQELKPWTQIGIKVVERSGDRLEDILHKSGKTKTVEEKTLNLARLLPKMRTCVMVIVLKGL